jgi:hypothetical protein
MIAIFDNSPDDDIQTQPRTLFYGESDYLWGDEKRQSGKITLNLVLRKLPRPMP